jgi:signal transduction histidine kinase
MKEDLEKLKKQIEELNEKLINAENYKTYFISHITNELVNPFTSILGLSKLLKETNPEEKEKIKQLSALIHSEAMFLQFQMSNLFVAARLEAGVVAVNPVTLDLFFLVNTIVEAFKKNIKEKNLIVNIVSGKGRKDFFSDMDILKVIMSNLVSNAINASEEGGEILVRHNVEESVFIFSVKNYGEVIPEDTLKKVFDRFQRGDPTINSVKTGSGMGLAVVKGLLDVLHGEIEFYSDKESGTEFRIMIPESISTACGIGVDEDDLFFDDDDDSESF